MAMQTERLLATTLRDVTVLPVEIDKARPLSLGLSAWLRDGTRVEGVYLRRASRVSWAPPNRPAERRIEGRHVYGGLYVPHYGHFLVDTLARYWYARGRDEPVIWQTAAHREPRLTPWQRDVFALLGVRVGGFVTCPTEFDELAIPDAGVATWSRIAPEHADALGVYPFRAPTRRRVWLSRSRWRRIDIENEDRLEALLARDGWTVLHPQAVPLREQLECMADASVIAGFEGSAFHTLLLARNIRAKVVIVPRAPGREPPGTYQQIASAKGFEQVVLHFPLSFVRGRGRGALHRLDDPAGLARGLR